MLTGFLTVLAHDNPLRLRQRKPARITHQGDWVGECVIKYYEISSSNTAAGFLKEAERTKIFTTLLTSY